MELKFARIGVLLGCLSIFLGSCSGDPEMRRAQEAAEKQDGRSAKMETPRKPSTNKDVTEKVRTSDDAQAEDVIIATRKALARKEKEWPYHAEYQLSFPPNVEFAGPGGKARIFAKTRTSLYSDLVAKGWASRIFIKQQKVYWEYDDQVHGSRLFRVSADLADASPDRWLKDHGFIFNSYDEIDEAVLAALRRALQGCHVLKRSREGTETRLTISTKDLGEVSVTVRGDEVVVTGGRDRKATFFRYSYHIGVPNWKPDPRAKLLAEFAKRKDPAPRVLEGDVSMDSAFDQEFGPLNGALAISLQKAKEHARRYGYLFPTKGVIRKAQTYSGQLDLETEMGGKTYWISQFPPRGRFPIQERYIKKRRKFGDYTVEAIQVTEGANPRIYIYYTNKDVMFILDDHAGFNDQNLDELIGSFRPLGQKSKR